MLRTFYKNTKRKAGWTTLCSKHWIDNKYKSMVELWSMNTSDEFTNELIYIITQLFKDGQKDQVMMQVYHRLWGFKQYTINDFSTNGSKLLVIKLNLIIDAITDSNMEAITCHKEVSDIFLSTLKLKSKDKLLVKFIICEFHLKLHKMSTTNRVAKELYLRIWGIVEYCHLRQRNAQALNLYRLYNIIVLHENTNVERYVAFNCVALFQIREEIQQMSNRFTKIKYEQAIDHIIRLTKYDDTILHFHTKYVTDSAFILHI